MGVLSKLITLCLLVLAPLCRAEWVYREDVAMTTEIVVEIWSEDLDEGNKLVDAVFAEFQRVDNTMSSYKSDSELSLLNAKAFSEPVNISKELLVLLQKAWDVSKLSAGSFDLTYGSIGKYYDFRAKEQPSLAQIETYAGKVSYRDVLIDLANAKVSYAKKPVRVDLGGIAKGHAVDRAIQILTHGSIRHGRVSAGGDMRLIGDKRGRPWVVGVRDPRSKGSNAVRLPLSDTAISTSGDYERYFIDDDGNRIHHIISPSTGKSSSLVQSVTILGPDATTTDGLSTAVFVMGVEKGMALINRLPGIDGIIIDNNRKLHYSNDLVPPRQN